MKRRQPTRALPNHGLEVTGLVLTIGEKTTPRALRSLKKQTLPCRDVVLVKKVFPFHRAMNHGIRRVQTPFFLQCDADMVPDPDCIDVLAGFLADDVGVVLGYLTDDLLGKIQAIKLFRTECFDRLKFPNSISPDTECINQMKAKGWRFVFATRQEAAHGHPPDILGAHKPEYSPLYTFNKFRLMGSRMRFRGVFREFASTMEKLRANPHPMAPIALIGLSRGLFEVRRTDGLRPRGASEDYRALMRYMHSDNGRNAQFAATTLDGWPAPWPRANSRG
jgi:hypothetical protein